MPLTNRQDCAKQLISPFLDIYHFLLCYVNTYDWITIVVPSWLNLCLILPGILNMTQLSVLYESKGGPKLFGQQLKNLEPFICSFIALTWKIFWESKVLCLTVIKIKWKIQLWPKEMTCSKRIKLKQDFNIHYPVDLKINKDSPWLKEWDVFKH